MNLSCSNLYLYGLHDLKNTNHPKPGSSIRVEPVRSLKDIATIKKLLVDSPRDLAIFTLGINSALRASDLVAIPLSSIQNLMVGESFIVKEKKTGKTRHVTINESVFRALNDYLEVRPRTKPKLPLFLSRKGGGGLTVPSLHRMVKSWCHEVGLKGNFESHTLRKTFGYHQRVTFKTELPILMNAFNHTWGMATKSTFFGSVAKFCLRCGRVDGENFAESIAVKLYEDVDYRHLVLTIPSQFRSKSQSTKS